MARKKLTLICLYLAEFVPHVQPVITPRLGIQETSPDLIIYQFATGILIIFAETKGTARVASYEPASMT